MPTDDEIFAQQRQMAVTRMLRPRAYSHTTYVDGAYGSFDPGDSEEGGWEGPEWVPADAKIHIDLVGGTPQGRAWVDGTGEVDVDTLLGADANTESGWGLTEYDPAGLAVDGYDVNLTVNHYDVALIGAARAMILDAATIVVKTKTIIDEISNPLVLLSEDGNDALEADLRREVSDDIVFYSWNGPLNNQIDGFTNDGVGVFNIVAMTITSSRFDGAINGSAAVAGVVDETDRPPGNPLIAVVYDPNLSEYLQSITIYDPLPSTAGLSELSEP